MKYYISSNVGEVNTYAITQTRQISAKQNSWFHMEQRNTIIRQADRNTTGKYPAGSIQIHMLSTNYVCITPLMQMLCYCIE